jgi:hypothetical protein
MSGTGRLTYFKHLDSIKGELGQTNIQKVIDRKKLFNFYE